ncbi:MAG: 4-(cytidine 5'-diphospho)-2-C-methyl-D-erythritol kinase [Lachnospiraceae bacterium]|nr:4-(cytidine 5'-diphospho)-2-C-methyl-D-erythritol kinase [Lachnospiraceae bacterium]
MEQITEKAYAKINLGLDVLRRRPDGYHEVKMIMQTVGICDMLTVKKSEKEGITLTVGQAPLPCNKDNLIYKAADMVKDKFAITEGVEISLEKNIPIAAGMAGGSSDAAAVFRAMNRLFDLHMSLADMQQMGVKIGADIPYCIMGGTALSEGIGEVLSALPAPPDAYLLIAKPDIDVSTKFVYENLHADTLSYHPDIDGMVEALQKADLQGITQRMGNVLETVTEKNYPVIKEIKDLMKEKGAENSLMSGSGPTVFGIYTHKEKAGEAYEAIINRKLAKQVFVTEFVKPEYTPEYA